jgi:hypothetical protein
MHMRKFAIIFLLGGIALFIAGANNQKPLMFVGIGMMSLAILGGIFGRRHKIDES